VTSRSDRLWASGRAPNEERRRGTHDLSAGEGLHVLDDRVPEMSVVLVMPDGYETIRTTMRHLRAQTARDRLEIVIVAPSVDALHLDHTELQEFLQFRVVEVGEVRSIAEGNAAWVRHASAPSR
jgi:hypothetical protein